MRKQKQNIILCVTGGRRFDDLPHLRQALDAVHREQRIKLLVHGDAPGADRMAGRWAEDNGIDVRKFPAEWSRHGKRAGPIRNYQMLSESAPDLVLAFPGGSGTQHCVDEAERLRIKVQYA